MFRSTRRRFSDQHPAQKQHETAPEFEQPTDAAYPAPISPITALIAVVRLIPWAVGSVAMIIIVAFANGSLRHLTTDSQITRWGIGVRALLHGKLWTIITSNFLIDHPTAIISTVVLSIVATGVCELCFGTWRAAFAWFMGTWAPLVLAIILLLPAHLLHHHAEVHRLLISEVGSSTATWCCAGAVVGFPLFVRDWRRIVGLAALALLVVILFVHPTFTSLEHFSAIGTGMALHHAWQRQPSRLGAVSRSTATRLMSIVCGSVFLIELALTGLWWGSIALLPIGLILIGVSLLVSRDVDWLLAALVAVGGIVANILEPNAATVLAVGAVLWLALYRGPWTLPEMASNLEGVPGDA
ncbi:MAG TPA: hypothetical protein VHV31_01345 [Nitrolancea sp.]|nr:hypothetical protein [Nitrolancea sp.]